MKKLIHSILNGLSPILNDNISTAAQTVRDDTSDLLKPDASLIHKSHSEISQIPPTFGFTFEHLQAIGFNLNAALNHSENCADQIPANGMTKYSPDIYIDKVGKVIAEIQAKAGSAEYIKKQVHSGYSTGNIITHSENYDISDAEIIINIEGIQNFYVNQELAQWIAKNPYLAAHLICAAATVGEVSGIGIKGGVVNATINILLQSIKTLGAYCRNEKEMAQAELYNLLQLSIDGLKQGYIRDAAIQVIQNLTKSSAFAVLGFTVSDQVIPVLIKVIQEQITIQQGISIVGIQAFTSGVVTTVVLLFPPIGMALLSDSVLQAIWQELTPQWQQFIIKTAKTTVDSTQKGILAGHKSLHQKPWDIIDSAATYSTTSSVEIQELQDELELSTGQKLLKG